MRIRQAVVNFIFSATIITAQVSSLADAAIAAHLDAAWYPQQRKQLTDSLQNLTNQAAERYNMEINGGTIRAIIVPHAALRYSGIVAAAAYRLVDAAKIDTIVIVAPSHAVAFHGVAVPHFDTYEIPTGGIRTAMLPNKLLTSPTTELFHQQQNAFRQEHSLEIQLPFIKFFFPEAKILPFIVGNITEKEIANTAQQLADLITPTTLIIVSTDMTHYGIRFAYTPFADHPLLRVRQLDSNILNALQQNSYLDLMKIYKTTQATVCGITPLAILMRMIEQGTFGKVSTRLVAYATSDDVSKETTGFVTYASLVVMKSPTSHLLSQYEKTQLLEYAQDILKNSFTATYPQELLQPIMTPLLSEHRAVFISLYKNNKGTKELRGCIGTTIATKPLYQNIADMTRAAAFHDTRFAPLKQHELKNLTLEISILEQPRNIASYRDIVLHQHGIILTVGSASALFLPQVAGEFGWTLEQTLEQLSKKAGLSANAWQQSAAKFQVFDTVNFATHIS